MTSRNVFVLAVLALGLFVTALSGHRSRVATAHHEEMVGPLDSPVADRADRNAIQRTSAARRILSKVSKPAPVGPPSLPEISEEELPVAQFLPVALDAQSAAAFDREVHSMAIDDDASDQMLQEVRSTVGTVTPVTDVMETRCTVYMCRIVLGHRTELEQSAIADRVGDAFPLGPGALYYHASDGAQWTTIYYVIRAGQPL
jgi:hypothetical protein